MSNNKLDNNYVKLGQLHYAMVKKSLLVMDLILSHDFDINYTIPINSPIYRRSPEWLGYTALHFAVIYNSTEGLKLLLKHGADFTVADHRGFTPLRTAYEKSDHLDWKLRKCDDSLIETLLTAHLISNNPSNPMCKNGMSHLHIACIQNSESVVELFLKAGVDVNHAVHADSPKFPGYTALHFASKCQNLTLVRLLLKYGADFNRKDADGLTPLHTIIKNSVQLVDEISQAPLEGKWYDLENDIILLIINDIIKLMKVDIDNLTCTDYVIRSHFHLSCVREKIPEDFENTFKTELDVNAAVSVDSPIFPGYTPLHFAAHFGIELVLELLKKGANLLTKDANGSTPLDLIVKRHTKPDVHKVLQSQLLSTESKLFFDVILIMDYSSAFHQYLKSKYNTNKQISFDSQVWPGYTLLHLAVRFNTDSNNIFGSNERESFIPILIKRMKYDRCEIVNECLCLHVHDVVVQDANGMTPLHLAFRLGELQIVDKILNSHESITSNPVDAQGLSHLHIACAANKPHLVDIFLDADSAADPDAPVKTGLEFVNVKLGRVRIEDGSTALHIAVAVGAEETVEALLRRGADPCRLDARGYSPLHLAFTDKTSQLSQLLLSSPKASMANPATKDGLSHLHVACHLFAGKLATVEALLSIALDMNEAIKPTDNSTSESRRIGEASSAISNLSRHMARFAGYTALHFAVQNSQLETIDLLVRAGADVRVKNATGLSPLHLALIKRRYDLNREIVQCLVASLDAKQHWPHCAGFTRLHVACAQLDLNKITELLESGADPNARINFDSALWPGDSPLHILIGEHKKLSWDAIDLLLKHGADVTLQNANGLTPSDLKYERHNAYTPFDNSRGLNINPGSKNGISYFHHLCQLGPGEDLAEVRKFLAHGIDVNAPVDHFSYGHGTGYTPLHYAAFSGNDDLIELLVQHGADVRAEDANGYTPLHVAAHYCPKSIEVLLKTDKIDVQAKNILDQTALELALKCSTVTNYDLMLLLKHNARFNIFNCLTKRGLLAIATDYCESSKLSLLLSEATDLTDIDENGRNAIHNIVSTSHYRDKFNIQTYHQIIEPIELLLKRGCDIDHRDSEGKTPLHTATILKNKFGIKALLQLGADVSIQDNESRTPYYKHYRDRMEWDMFIIQTYEEYLFMLNITGLYISPEMKMNVKRYTRNSILESIETSLTTLDDVKITEKFTVRDLFKKNNFLWMSEEQYSIISKFVESLDRAPANVKNWSGLIRLQYRKISKRMRFLTSAIDTFNNMMGFQLPDLCIENVFQYLGNEDLKNLSHIDQQ